MSNDNNTIIPDDIISTINDFKRSKNGSMISIHGKEYATVAHRIAVVRRNLGAKLQILTEIISVDKDTVVMKASGLIGGKVNSVQPQKRMLSSMTPTIIEKDGKLSMILGSPGGPTIITSILQTILNVYLFNEFFIYL